MELRQLRYFCAVADEQHLGRAAERLGLRSPSVSEQIRALERELGAQLFHRTPGGMSLTPAGDALLPEARRTLAAAARAARAVREATAPVRACVIGVPPGVPPDLPRRIREAARGAPLRFEDLPSGDQPSRVRNGDLDCCLLTLPAEDAGGLVTAVIHDEPLGVLMAAEHPLAARTVIDWADLDGQELLWFQRDLAPGYHDDVLAACHRAGWRPRPRIVRARRAIVLAELTCGDPVVALRPAWDTGPGLGWRPLADEPPRLRYALAWPGDVPHSGPAGIARRLAR
ncbi:LysR family transcriptional regulator [Actinoallomurus sp. CA-150999]|uniref:LysR family transcriptional regulator n=1 Tax=Actinoallomurus sp. CA-150999 TaxID=3239887 RepID=UPI003D8D3D2F